MNYYYEDQPNSQLLFMFVCVVLVFLFIFSCTFTAIPPTVVPGEFIQDGPICLQDNFYDCWEATQACWPENYCEAYCE